MHPLRTKPYDIIKDFEKERGERHFYSPHTTYYLLYLLRFVFRISLSLISLWIYLSHILYSLSSSNISGLQ